MLLNGEVPPRRFFGRAKDFGLQYVRGIAEGNGRPPGDDLWVTYSSNKEDIWVSRVPVPLRHTVDQPAADTFDDVEPGGIIRNWNLYRPRWADVRVEAFPSARNHSLRLEDRDPHDHAGAVRVFPQARDAEVRLTVNAQQQRHGRLEIEILGGAGQPAVQVALDEGGTLRVNDGGTWVDAGRYVAGRWHRITLRASAVTSRFDLRVDGRVVAREARFAVATPELQRVSFRTGRRRAAPTRADDRYAVQDDVPRADDQDPLAVYRIDDVAVVPLSPPR